MNKTPATPVVPQFAKSIFSRVLPTEEKPKEKEPTKVASSEAPIVAKPKKKKRRERVKKAEKREAPEEPPLPPDPGYIPKIRITTYRSLSGSALHQSNQFKLTGVTHHFS